MHFALLAWIFCLTRPFRLLHECSLLPNPNPWKDHCPVAGMNLPVSENTHLPVAFLVLSLWPAGQHITCDSLLEQRGVEMDSRFMGGQDEQWEKDKTSGSSGNQSQIEEINLSVLSKIDCMLAAGIDICQRSLMLQSCTHSHNDAL